MYDIWLGQALEAWDERVAETIAGGIRIDRDDIILERAARLGIIAAAHWMIDANPVRISFAHE